eukprot:m.135565 g.135565  ORF g.135565 m.135565 type:complete len:321 (-) comp22606_c0_seq2:2493-3455(-)
MAARADGVEGGIVSRLEGTMLCDLPSKQVPVTVEASTAPKEAYAILLKANVQSAPVYDSAQKKYVGTLDLRDLVPAIVKKGDSDDADGNAGPELLDRILKVSAEMRGLPSDALPLLINPGGFRSVSEEGSLDDATRQLMHKGCYRVSVLNSAGDAINVISQSTVISWLQQHVGEFQKIGSQTVAAAGCGTSPVLAVKDSDPILTAFALIAENDITGVAVINDDGLLVSAVAASDLKALLCEASSVCSLSTVEFLTKVRQDGLGADQVAVRSTDTLAHVITKLASTKAHRVYVVENGKATSVISLTDLLRHIYTNPDFADW